jgi:MSHA type pilus biogenesis protein MshL
MITLEIIKLFYRHKIKFPLIKKNFIKFDSYKWIFYFASLRRYQSLRMRMFFFLLFTCFLLTSCRDMVNHHPVMPTLNKKEAKELVQPLETNPKLLVEKSGTSPETPKIPKEMQQRVCISVSESIPLKSVLVELARQANIDLQLDHSIDAKVIFTAQNTPFIDVIKSICEMAKLRYDVVNNSIRIERDTPYSQNYNVQFLSLSRISEDQLAVASDVFSSVGPAKSNINDNISKSALKATAKNDFWEELEQNLKAILESEPEKGSYSIHRQAGLVTIRANRKQHEQAHSYLEKLKRIASCQVLIEAKIIEVTLKDEYRSGINWQIIDSKNDLQLNARFGDIAQKGSFLDPTSAQTNMISFGASGSKFSAISNSLQEFGFVRTLSSPRITVMNNQTAILKVAQNKVYFRLNYDKIYNSLNNRENTTVSSDIQTVPIGLIMLVQPSIDLNTGEILLFLRPSISRLTQTVADPAIDIAFNSSINIDSNKLTSPTQSMIPVVEVREIDSVLRLHNKEMAILGGLMEVRSSHHEQNLPGLESIPLVRDLTGSIAEGDTIVELVIVLRATIVDNGSKIDEADHRLINKYISDPRPF